jgi:hypothetical protein
MTITTPPVQSERRDQPRRSADRAVDDLHKTFSNPHCHSCLERMADGVLLLDKETRIIYTTPQVNQILKRHDLPFAISPKFTLRQPHHASRFAAFVNGKNQEAGPRSACCWKAKTGAIRCCLTVSGFLNLPNRI